MDRAHIVRHDLAAGTSHPLTEGEGIRSDPAEKDGAIFYLVMNSLSSRNLYVLQDGQEVKVTDDLFIASYCFVENQP